MSDLLGPQARCVRCGRWVSELWPGMDCFECFMGHSFTKREIGLYSRKIVDQLLDDLEIESYADTGAEFTRKTGQSKGEESEEESQQS